jgi:hypothetical protein
VRPGDSGRSRLPKGVEALERPRGGRAYRATLRRGKGVVVHLGLYETPWLAGLAHATAADLLGRDAPPMDVPVDEQPTAEQVRELTARVRGRLKLDAPARARRAPENPPQTEDLLTFFEVTVVGFWRGQSSSDDSDHPDAGLDAAAGRLASAASLLFWSRASGHPDPLDAMTELLSRRLDQAFRRPDLTRELLNDDGDDPFRVARWLVMPDGFVSRRGRGFREEIRHLYVELFEADLLDDGPPPPWAAILGLSPPFSADRVRAAYRARSLDAHPDAGGTASLFVRLRAAYEDAIAYLAARGL